ncbi:hypothetical protein K8P10_000666 [Leucobacter sp. Psy1]|nr:hypothetical protein K8P10_000666 [Leucobacter sp. Psy1]
MRKADRNAFFKRSPSVFDGFHTMPILSVTALYSQSAASAPTLTPAEIAKSAVSRRPKGNFSQSRRAAWARAARARARAWAGGRAERDA